MLRDVDAYRLRVWRMLWLRVVYAICQALHAYACHTPYTPLMLLFVDYLLRAYA